MESVKLLKSSKKENSKHGKKAGKKESTFFPDFGLNPIATPNGNTAAAPSSNPSTPTSSSVIPFLSPVYIMVHQPMFPEDTEDYNKGNGRTTPREKRGSYDHAESYDSDRAVGGGGRSPRRERGSGDKKGVNGGKKNQSPTKLADPTTMLLMFQSRSVL